MRCLCRLVATALSLVPAVALVYPSAQLQDTVGDNLNGQSHDANAPVQTSHVDTEGLEDPEIPVVDPQGDDATINSIHAWLNDVTASQVTEGAILTSSLFETFTSLSASASLVTAAPQVSASGFPSSREHIQVDDVDVDDDDYGDDNSIAIPPRPTSIHFRPASRYAAQKPLGSFGRVWTSAQNKLKTISKFFCPLDHERQRQQQQQPLSAFIRVGSSASEPDSDHHSSVVPSRPLPDRPALTTRAAVPTGTAVAAALAAGAIAPQDKAPSNVAALPAGDASDTLSLAQVKDKHLLAIVLSVLATILLTWCIFLFLLRRNPRRRAERLAAWEECANRRIYARAAFVYRLRSSAFDIVGKLGYFGARIFVKPVSPVLEKEAVVLSTAHSESISIEERFLREVHSFRHATEQIESIIQAEEGVVSHALGKQVNRNQRRTYTWLFGRRMRRPRANSGSESDCGSERSDGEKSGLTPPPPYADRELYVKIPDIVVAKMTVEAPDVSDRSSISSHVPTSPKEGSMTLGSHDGDSMQEDV